MSVRVEERRGTAGDLHADDWPDAWTGSGADEVVVRRCEVTDPALVLGSTQDPAIVDLDEARRRGVDVVRRRSGGGAVLLAPGGCTWVDLYLPATDARWDDRVDRSFAPVGAAWLAAVAALGVAHGTVHDGGLVADGLGRLVCFAGIGPGEVRVGDRKLVGMSQRRTRRGARFQCLVPHSFDAAAHVALLRPQVDPVELRGRIEVLDRPPADVVAAFVAAFDGDPSVPPPPPR